MQKPETVKCSTHGTPLDGFGRCHFCEMARTSESLTYWRKAAEAQAETENRE